MLDRQEIARYLGYGGATLDAAALALAEQCEAAFLAHCLPRRGARGLPLGDLPFLEASADLRGHLRHCQRGYLIALTLGGEADRLLRQWAAVNIAKAAVGQAVAAAWMDLLCDEYMEALSEDLPEGEYLTTPFSPGYGDFSLHFQAELLRYLDANRLGISLSAGGMLLPQKSMTAVLGISRVPAEHCRASCQNCGKEDCLFRKGARR